MNDFLNTLLQDVQEIIYFVKINRNPLGGSVQFISKQVERVLGYKPEEFIQNPNLWFSVIHPDEREQVKNDTLKMFEEAKSTARTYRIRHKTSGAYLWIEEKLTPQFDFNGNSIGYCGVAHDVTESKKNDQRLSIQYAVTSILMEAKTFDDAILKIFKAVCDGTGWKRGEFWSTVPDVDMKSNCLRCTQSYSSPPTAFQEFEKITLSMTFQLGVGLPGRVWASGQPIWIEDVVKDELFPRVSIAAKEGIHMGIGFPVIAEEEVIGVMTFFNHNIAKPDNNLLQTFKSIGAQIGQYCKRKRAEIALQEREFFLRESQRVASIGSYKTDFIKGQWESSQALDAIFGIGKEYGRSVQGWLDIVHPLDHDMMDNYLKDEVIAKRKRFDKEYRIIRVNDKQERWVHGTGEVKPDERGNILSMIGTIQDITKRKLAEEALKTSEASYRQLFEAAKDGILIIDAETGEIRDVNPFLKEMLGYSHTEFLGKQLWELGLFKDIIANKESFRELQAKRYIRYENLPLQTKDGGQIWAEFVSNAYDLNGKQVIQCDIRDITDRKRAEQSLRDSEVRYRILAEAAEDSIFIVGKDYRVQYINVFAAQAFKKEPRDIIGKPLADLFPPHVADMQKNSFEAVFETGESLYEEVLTPILSRAVWMGTRLVPIKNESGEITAVLGIARDITERKKHEKNMLRSQRMESIGTLAGGIAHDLNNVFGPILLAMDILRQKLTDEQGRALLNMIEETTLRGADLVKQVLSFARGVDGERTLIQIRHLVDEVTKVLRQTFPKSITIRTNMPRVLPTISCDATQIHQVLMNLCVNARDAMPKGGAIEITAEDIVLDEHYVRMHHDAKPGRHAVITVTDQGSGMPPEVLERVFEPFFTTKEFGKGTGLGLSTVLSITRGHGGFLTVYSEMGKGTTFKVYLPTEDKGESVSKRVQQKPPNGNGELILVVDDEKSIREITKTTLEAYGYSVLTASDGTEAITAYATQRDKIALIVTDMMMPYMDGAATIRAIHKMNPKAKILAVSGLKQDEEVLKHDAVKFLHKPYTSEKLLNVIQQIISKQDKEV